MFGADNCKFQVQDFVFGISSVSDTDPRFRFYGKLYASDLAGIRIVDQTVELSFTASGGQFVGTAATTQEFAIFWSII